MTSTVYLDTANWMDLCTGAADKELFDKKVDAGEITPVLSLVHMIELANIATQHRNDYAAYLNHIVGYGKHLWIKSHPSICRLEAKRIFHEWIGIAVEPIGVFARHLVDVFEQKIGMLETAEARAYSIGDIIQLLTNTSTLPEHHSFRQAFPSHRKLIQKVRRNRLRSNKKEKMETLLAYLPERIDIPTGIVFDVTDQMKKQFAKEIQFHTCTLINLICAYHDGANVHSDSGSPSDVEDLYHLAGIAYCDVSFADKRTVDLLQKGQATIIPHRNESFSRWLKSL